MPGTYCHVIFADMVYRILSKDIQLDKIKFISGNIIPDLAVASKTFTHYRKKSSIPEIFVPDMERVKNELFTLEDPIKLGMFCHLYLDYHFTQGFLIPGLTWDRPRMKIVNPRNGLEWDPETFFRKGDGVYYRAFSELNSIFIKDANVVQTILELSEKLPNTGIEMFDVRQEDSWKKDLEKCIEEYTGSVFDYEQVMNFMEKTAIKLATEITTEYGKKGYQ